MDAIISGSACIAATIDGDSATIINISGEIVKHTKYVDVLMQFQLYEDTILVTNTNKRDTLNKLRAESEKSDALLFVLSILDSKIESEIKSELASYANNLLKSDIVLKYLRGNLFSRPLPENTIKEVPLEIRRYSIISEFLEGLISSQDSITNIYNTWSTLVQQFRIKEEDIGLIEGVFATENLAYYLSVGKDNKKINQLKFTCHLKLNTVPSHRQVIAKLFQDFTDNSHEIHRVLPIGSNNSISSKYETQKKPNTPRQGKKFYEQAQSQIKRAEEYIEQNDILHAKRIASELVSSQIARGDHKYAAMSLCTLSEKAKSIEDYSLQLDWAKQASDISPEDSRTYGHVADAYLNLHQLQNAYIWFNKTVEMEPSSTYGRTGLARILRLRFDYESALNTLDNVLELGFRDSETLSLKAEVLRDLGRFEDAEALYRDLSSEFPESSRNMCGLGAVMVDQRKFEEAQEVYNDSIRLYPDEHVAYSSLGFLLARLGNFEEGINLIDKGIQLTEGNSELDYISYFSKAKALIMNGENALAEDIYKWLISKASHLIDARILLIQLLLDTNQCDEAINVLESTKVDFPEDERLKVSQALILKYQMDYIGALKIFDEIKMTHPRWIDPLLERANVLKRLGKYSEARIQYEDILLIRSGERRAQLGVATLDAINKSTLTNQVEFETIEQPVLIDDWNEIQIKGLIMLSNGQIEAANDLFTEGGENTVFDCIKPKLACGLSMAKIKSGELQDVSKVLDSVADDSRQFFEMIIHGEEGNFQAFDKDFRKYSQEASPAFKSPNVIRLVTERYGQIPTTMEDKPSIDDVIDLQIREMLIAA